MKISVKRKSLEQGITGITALVLMVSLFIGISLTNDYVLGATINVTNNSVLARVNVTNTQPNITSVTLDDDTLNPAGEIDLIANEVTVVTCNATIFDYNGYNDINPDKTNGTLFINSVGSYAEADNNYLYRNESCGRCTQNDGSNTNVSCDCRFAVKYYANASSNWMCNISVTDKGGTAVSGQELNLTSWGTSGTVIVNRLLAINTTTDAIIDYGNLSVTQTSSEVPFNVTNAGNTKFNLTLRGYGGTEDPIGENWTMMCAFGNISIGYQKYWLGETGWDWADMISLGNQTALTNLTLNAKQNDTSVGWEQNTTYWKLKVPLSVGGICNGTVVFGAVDAEIY